MRWTFVPLGSEYVVWLREVVWLFMVLEEEDVVKDWKVDWEVEVGISVVRWVGCEFVMLVFG